MILYFKRLGMGYVKMDWFNNKKRVDDKKNVEGLKTFIMVMHSLNGFGKSFWSPVIKLERKWKCAIKTVIIT